MFLRRHCHLVTFTEVGNLSLLLVVRPKQTFIQTPCTPALCCERYERRLTMQVFGAFVNASVSATQQLEC